MTKSKPTQPEWEELFDQKFYGQLNCVDDTGGFDAKPYLKLFISQNFYPKAEVKRAVEGMKKGLPLVRPEERSVLHEIDAYNQALTDLLTKLEE